jgi:hypothetical protein
VGPTSAWIRPPTGSCFATGRCRLDKVYGPACLDNRIALIRPQFIQKYQETWIGRTPKQIFASSADETRFGAFRVLRQVIRNVRPNAICDGDGTKTLTDCSVDWNLSTARLPLTVLLPGQDDRKTGVNGTSATNRPEW